jgi:hypothetical protein
VVEKLITAEFLDWSIFEEDPIFGRLELWAGTLVASLSIGRIVAGFEAIAPTGAATLQLKSS